jgi:hypothetical protein
MQKHKFGVMCPGAFFVENVLVPPEHEKYYIDVSRPGHSKMHYVTPADPRRMQKHKFGVTCHGALFSESIPVPLEYKK